MNIIILIAALITLIFAGAALLAVVGFRNGDRPDDARVTAVTVTDHPDDGTAEVAVTIANSGGSPVLIGLSPRRPGLPGCGMRATTPFWTIRRRYCADKQVTMGALPPRRLAGYRFLSPSAVAASRSSLASPTGACG